ncbi:MAG: CpsB/CapC family capsule biosynthesis tyrosine phosphatase [Chitinophagaceae bacterium]
MFNFFKKEKQIPEVREAFPVTIDFHSHILPGIDDGSPDIATSIILVQGLYDIGYRKLVATPHVIGDFYKNNPEIINTQLERLKVACVEAGIKIELSAAAEYMLDDYFLGLLKKKDQILTVYKNFILTELPYSVMPMNVNEIVFEIITAGYKPILAHPERYFYYHKNFDEFFRLKELGFLLQINLLSITGYYGPPVAKAARFIFENDLADFVGTDLHHIRHLEALGKKENVRLFNKYMDNKVYNNFE